MKKKKEKNPLEELLEGEDVLDLPCKINIRKFKLIK
jgi:hypothetical protein